MTDSALVRLERRGALVEIILNRPDKRNAIHWPLMEALDGAMHQTGRLEGARVILLRGEGSGFSAGLDLMGFQEIAARFGENWRDDLFPLTQAFQRIVTQFERGPLPTIALLHGYCLGLGLELALACDFRIAAEGTKLALPESRLGIIPDVGGTTRLTRLIGPSRAKELILTGRTIDAAAAERLGIVNGVAPADALLAQGEALAAELIEAAPLAVRYGRQIINEMVDLERGLGLEAWAQSILIRTQDFEIGAQAMLTRQTPEWKGR